MLPVPTFTVPLFEKSLFVVRLRPLVIVKLDEGVELDARFDNASSPAASTMFEFVPLRVILAALFTISPPFVPKQLICKVLGKAEVPLT